MHDFPNRPGGSHAFSMHPSQQRELERLRRQALMAWPEEERWLKQLGLGDGMRVLDVGCGAGLVTEKLAALNPSGETVGLEPDPALARMASSVFKGCSGLSLHIGSMSENRLAEDYFDFAYARFVFQHVPAPLDELRNLLPLLKPGGRLVLADADDGLTVLYPELPELGEIMQLLEARQAKAGGDRRIGRKLAGLLTQAGFTDVGFHVLPFTSHALGRSALLELAVTSRLIRLDESAAAAVSPLADRMNEFYAEREWYGLACVIAAFGIRP